VLCLSCSLLLCQGSDDSHTETRLFTLEQAEALLDAGKREEAISNLREYIRIHPRDFAGYVLLGSIYADASQPEQAAPLLRQAVTLAPRSADAHLNLGVVEISLGNREAGKREFQIAVTIDPAKSEALYNLGKLAFEEKDYAAAAGFFSRFVASSPMDIEGLLHLLQCGIKTSDAKTVTRIRSNLLNLAPGDGNLHMHIGDWLTEARDYEAAQEEFGLALRLLPASDEVRFRYAAMYLQWGQPQKALELLSPVASSHARDAFFHHLLGQCHERELDPVKACLEYEQAIKIDPDQELYYLSLASLFLSQRVISAAEKVLTEARTRFPGSAPVRVATGFLELEAGSPDDAMNDYTQAVAIAPSSPLACQLLGRIQMAEGKYKEAVSALRRAAQLNPTDAQADFYMGLAYMNLENEADMALNSFLRSLKLDPDSASTYYWIGAVYLRRKHQYNLAAQYLQEALRRAPGWGAAHQLLIQCYRFLGDDAKAAEQSRKYRDAMWLAQPRSDLHAFLERR